MDQINIQITENQSTNFFSRLQQQINESTEKDEKTRDLQIQEQTQEQVEQPQEQTQPQEQPQLINTNEFLNKINSTSKNLGHNKLQLRIDELEDNIQKSKIVEKEQEMKLNLFKKTISTLQAQLQDKSAHISRIESNHIDPQYEKTIADLRHEISSLKMDFDNVQQDNRILKSEIDFLDKTLQSTKLEYNTIGDKSVEVQQRYNLLEQTYQKQANQLQIDLETISRLENKLNLELNIKQNLELELQSLKLELADYRTNIKNLTIIKDNEIKLLTEKLREKSDNNETEIKNDKPDITTIRGGPRGIKISNGKGIKISNGKGIRSSR